ncbi:unnamed protein product [Lactuca virosa]|uniref:Uncharacterized protein n=1 Tax=Lactuca virosa TaxID=75947 RepID=A0AAU9MJK0_9ASTR|nr:unnamed protein product [Lactuca virosa]
MWPPTDFIPPLPPMKRRMPGRPNVNRRRDASEKLPMHTVSKAGKTISCSVCKNVGHNKVTCPQAERPQVQKPEVGRRPKLNVKKRKTGVNGKGEAAGGVNGKGEGAGGVNGKGKGEGDINGKGEGAGDANGKGEGEGGGNDKGEGAGGVNEGQNGQGAKSVHEGQKGQGAAVVAAGRISKRKK